MLGLIYNVAFGDTYHAMAAAQMAELRRQMPSCDFVTVESFGTSAFDIAKTRPSIRTRLLSEYDFALQIEPDISVGMGAEKAISGMLQRGMIQVQAGPTQIRRLYPPNLSDNFLPAPWASFVFVPRNSFGFFDHWAIETERPFFFEERALLDALRCWVWSYATCVRHAMEPSHGEPFVHHLGPDKSPLNLIAA